MPKKKTTKGTDENGKPMTVEVVETDKKGKPIYRDENGVRIQSYKRFKKNVDYEPITKDEMSAMIGMIKNQSRNNIGRPRKYEDIQEFLGAIDAFWDYIDDNNQRGIKLLPDIEGFCAYIGIARVTLSDWERTRNFEFSSTIKELKNQIAFVKKQLALTGKIPPIVFATDFNNNHGYVQNQQPQVVVHTTANEIRSLDDISKLVLPEKSSE